MLLLPASPRFRLFAYFYNFCAQNKKKILNSTPVISSIKVNDRKGISFIIFLKYVFYWLFVIFEICYKTKQNVINYYNFINCYNFTNFYNSMNYYNFKNKTCKIKSCCSPQLVFFFPSFSKPTEQRILNKRITPDGIIKQYILG